MCGLEGYPPLNANARHEGIHAGGRPSGAPGETLNAAHQAHLSNVFFNPV